jgi:hypothetical protein
MLFKGLPIPWWHILRNPITSAHNHPITHIPMDHDGPSWDTEIHGIIHPHDGYIYIYLEAPLVHKNLYHFFLYHFENYVRFKGCKKKVHVYFGPPNFLCPKGASRLKPP